MRMSLVWASSPNAAVTVETNIVERVESKAADPSGREPNVDWTRCDGLSLTSYRANIADLWTPVRCAPDLRRVTVS